MGRALEPLHLALGLGDEDPHPHHLGDGVVVAPDLAAVRLEHLLLVGIGRRVPEAVVPPVRVLGHRAQQVLLAVTAHQDGRHRVGARLAVGAGDLIVLTLVAGGGVAPHPADELDGLAELCDAHAGGRERPAVGAVLLLVPARPDAQDDAPARQRLGGRRHLGEVRGIAEAVAQHLVAAELVRIAGQRVGEERPALRDRMRRVLDVIREPERVERVRGLVQVREGGGDEARPDIETDGDGQGALREAGARTSWPCRRHCAAARRRGSGGSCR